MKSLHSVLRLVLVIAFFFGGLLAFYSYDADEDSAELASHAPSSLTKKNKIKNLEGRALEDSTILNQTTNLNDEPSVLFNDPAIAQAWGLKKSKAGKAWGVTKGSKNVVVAIIDTGIDVNHEDLKGNIWTNPGETGLDSKGRDKATNGIDDDGNGFIDDVHGWNFVSNTPDLTDNHGHGTHIAGIIGAEANNGKGISGIAPEVSLMILKYYDPKVANTDNLKNTIKAIHYAVQNGAQIINYSGGGTDYSREEYEAVKLAEQKGILFVAAAGNEQSNSDKNHYYPADYGLSNLISVTAINPSTEVLPSSNWGTETVDIAAPGQNIMSTLPKNYYGLMTGTSQATAFVTGAAVLVKANRPSFKYSDIKRHILATGDAEKELQLKTRTARQLNLYRCLTVLDTDVSITGVVVSDLSNPDKITGLKSGSSENDYDPNMRKDSHTAEMKKFGSKLKNLIQRGEKERLGRDNNQNND
jgi:subtilisin family serine protease